MTGTAEIPTKHWSVPVCYWARSITRARIVTYSQFAAALQSRLAAQRRAFHTSLNCSTMCGVVLKALLTITLWLGCVAAHAAAINACDLCQLHAPSTCKEVLTDDGIKTWKGGMCLGTVRSLFVVNAFLDKKYKFCPPPGVGPQDAIRAIMSSTDEQPGMLDENFVVISLVVLQRKWPCK